MIKIELKTGEKVITKQTNKQTKKELQEQIQVIRQSMEIYNHTHLQMNIS